MSRPGPIMLTLLLLFAEATIATAQQRYLSDLPAARWMQSPAEERDVFVGGFLAGVQHVLRGLGMDVRSRGSGWTAATLSNE